MTPNSVPHVAVIGGGPAGLIAAEVLAAAGVKVSIFDRKPNVGRKFLMAGRGGLNLTHSEDREKFLSRYGAAAEFMTPLLENFSPDDLRNWCETLGEKTFIGSSGRVFPESFKASPLLRHWLKRLDGLGVSFAPSHRWTGWSHLGRLTFMKEEESEISLRPDATLLALGGASWPRLGADGSWVSLLEGKGIPVTPLRPSNCGFAVDWSDVFKDKFAGVPLKPVGLSFGSRHLTGEIMISRSGIEGGAVYALSAALRDEIERAGHAVLYLDLRSGVGEADLCQRLKAPRARLSFSNFMRKYSGLSPVAISLLREGVGGGDSVTHLSSSQLAARIKKFPLKLVGTGSLDRAISTAGGVPLDALTDGLMLKKLPSVYVAGEMLDWEAPTGGYLLQGCFSTGVWAAQNILKQLGF